MKQYLILFAAVIGFAACNEEASNEVNFAEMPVAEVLTVDGGIDWLIQQTNAVNWAAFKEDTKNKGFIQHLSVSRMKDVGESEWSSMDGWRGGSPLPNYLFLDDQTVRTCFSDSTGNYGGALLYLDYPYVMNEIDKTLSYDNEVITVLYYQAGTLILERANSSSTVQIVYSAGKSRQEMLELFTTEAIPENMLKPY